MRRGRFSIMETPILASNERTQKQDDTLLLHQKDVARELGRVRLSCESIGVSSALLHRAGWVCHDGYELEIANDLKSGLGLVT
jgi:hypothetical protein